MPEGIRCRIGCADPKRDMLMLTVTCPHCGSFNDESATVCYMCKMKLPSAADREGKAKEERFSNTGPAKERREAAWKRPGCVSIYAALTFLQGVFGIFAALSLPTLLANNTSLLLDASTLPNGFDPINPDFLSFLRTYIMVYSILAFLFSILNLLLGWGLWGMRNWARIIILVTQGLSLLGGVFILFYSIIATNGSLIVCGINALSLIIPGIIFFWFFLNRRLFR